MKNLISSIVKAFTLSIIVIQIAMPAVWAQIMTARATAVVNQENFDFQSAAKAIEVIFKTTEVNTLPMTSGFPNRPLSGSEVYELHGYVDMLVAAGMIDPDYTNRIHLAVENFALQYGNQISPSSTFKFPGNYRDAVIAGFWLPAIVIIIIIILVVDPTMLIGDPLEFTPLHPSICHAPTIQFPDLSDPIKKEIEEIENDPNLSPEEKRDRICIFLLMKEAGNVCISDEIRQRYAHCFLQI